jgi:8-oxo-dGTP diphosphatase
MILMMPASDQGVSSNRYTLIPRVLIFVTRAGSFLLLKGASTKRLWPDRYNGIGGHVELCEDILSAARRELFEETGLQANLWLCGTVVVDTGGNPGIGIFIFTGECPDGQPRPSVEGTLEWFSCKELDHIPVVEDVPEYIDRIQKMKPGDPPFSGRLFYDDSGGMSVEFA